MRNNPNAYFLFLSAINEEITKLKKYIIFFIIMTMYQKYCSILETLIIPQSGKKYITRDLYVNNPSQLTVCD